MKDNRDNLNDERMSSDDDQLRSNTMNEVIREANGDADINLNDLKEDVAGADRSHDHDSQLTRDRDALTQGMSYSPNDASGVRSGGTADMDDQTRSGAGLNTGRSLGSGSGLAPKTGVTGSDFDGQNATS